MGLILLVSVCWIFRLERMVEFKNMFIDGDLSIMQALLLL